MTNLIDDRLRVIAINDSDRQASYLLGPTVDVRTATFASDADVTIGYFPGNAPRLSAIIDAVSSEGWAPDCALVMFPEFFPVPDELFETTLPVACFISDWHLAYSRLVNHLHLYDSVLIDSVGVDAFRAERGITNCRAAPVYHAGEQFQRSAQNIAQRPVDIGFVGNLARVIQYERAPWIYRLTTLAEKGISVRIGHDVRGAEYISFLHSCKIIFNRTIRSEYNMRCHEALAAGCVLMVEDTNRGMPEYLVEGEDYLRYSSDFGSPDFGGTDFGGTYFGGTDFESTDFESAVIELLGDPQRLESIAASGHRAYLLHESKSVHAAVFSDELRTLAHRTPVAMQRQDYVGLIEQQTFFEGRGYAPESIPPSATTAQLLSTIDPNDSVLPGCLANRLAKSFLTLVNSGKRHDEVEMAPWFDLIVHLYAASARNGSITHALNSLSFLHLCGVDGEVAHGCEAVVTTAAACTDPAALEGVLLLATLDYKAEYLVREQMLARYGFVEPVEYLQGLKAITQAIALLLQGDSCVRCDDTEGALSAWQRANTVLPIGIDEANDRISRLSYELIRLSLVPGVDPSSLPDGLVKSCRSSSEAILTTSVLAAETTLVALFHLYITLDRDDDASALFDKYIAATACVVGSSYHDVVRDTIAMLRDIASSFSKSHLVTHEP